MGARVSILSASLAASLGGTLLLAFHAATGPEPPERRAAPSRDATDAAGAAQSSRPSLPENTGAARGSAAETPREGLAGRPPRERVRQDAGRPELAPPVRSPDGEQTFVEGRLTDRAGQPVAGARVFLDSPARAYRRAATSLPDGTFRFEGVPPGEDYRFEVQPQGLLRSIEEPALSVPPQGLILDGVLDPIGTGSLRGRLVDGLGLPLAGVPLRLRTAGRKTMALASDAGGYFAIAEVPEGEVLLEAGGAASTVASGIEIAQGLETYALVAADSGEHELRGAVLDASGAPVEAARVGLYWRQATGTVRSTSHRQSLTGPDGRFAFSALGPGDHLLRVNAPGYSSRELVHPIGSSHVEAVVELESTGSPRPGRADP